MTYPRHPNDLAVDDYKLGEKFNDYYAYYPELLLIFGVRYSTFE